MQLKPKALMDLSGDDKEVWLMRIPLEVLCFSRLPPPPPPPLRHLTSSLLPPTHPPTRKDRTSHSHHPTSLNLAARRFCCALSMRDLTFRAIIATLRMLQVDLRELDGMKIRWGEAGPDGVMGNVDLDQGKCCKEGT